MTLPVLQSFEKDLTKIVFAINQHSRGLNDAAGSFDDLASRLDALDTAEAAFTAAFAPQSGRLILGAASPTTTLKFVPYNGDAIKINGVIYPIPSAGVSAGQTGVYVNGVAGQILSPPRFIMSICSTIPERSHLIFLLRHMPAAPRRAISVWKSKAAIIQER